MRVCNKLSDCRCMVGDAATMTSLQIHAFKNDMYWHQFGSFGREARESWGVGRRLGCRLIMPEPSRTAASFAMAR